MLWNGGGSSNYTEILAKGGYKSRSTGTTVEDVETRISGLVNKAEKVIDQELGAIYSEIKKAVIV
ncbi:vacuolar serine proteinase [Penicillium maclennaniae]|uniref:vacuolar serine proteinase n=1 Tax=Penicillium maclennaniae TaxID=1343394 RepID=UPI002540B486|nr:vacuolar serine proteinase [Penicillium maclennaniae]KAJ5661879.1 vacuolar serine proteinase [Penicillium maclennaniae]